MRLENNECRSCRRPLPSPFLDLAETPLANSFVRPENSQEPEPRFPLQVAYCNGCHLVQLRHVVPPSELFSTYLYFSSFSDSYLQHAREMAETLARSLNLDAGSRVLEIASNDGYLLRFFRQMGIRVLGVEPAANIAQAAIANGIPTLVRFFGPEAVPEVLGQFGAADLIIGNNVLAHVPEVTGFLASVRECLTPAGRAVFEFPYVLDLLHKTEFDTIYHEHIFYYSVASIRALAARAGLELTDAVRQSVHGGSLRVTLTRSGVAVPSPEIERLLADERAEGLLGPDRYAAFSTQVQELRAELRRVLLELRGEGRRIAAYGAPAKGNTLLNYCGLDSGLIEFTVDRNTHKQGLLLPGSRIPIHGPEAILREMPHYVLVLPWNISEEIIDQQRAYLEQGGAFVIPVPRPSIVRTAPVRCVATA